MKVFISWSGNRSRLVAEALREWLPKVLPGAEPWVSSRDITAGSRWNGELAEQLEESSFGIVCLTHDNLDSRWLNFEAGALAKSVGRGKVVPYLCEGLADSEVMGPLSQFQTKRAERCSTWEMVQEINKHLPDRRDHPCLKKAFDRSWRRLEETLARVPSIAPSEAQSKIWGFCSAVLGNWWSFVGKEYARQGRSIGFITIVSDPATGTVKITGRSYGDDGTMVAHWKSVACCIPDRAESILPLVRNAYRW
jgi:hypothetical protein